MPDEGTGGGVLVERKMESTEGTDGSEQTETKEGVTGDSPEG